MSSLTRSFSLRYGLTRNSSSFAVRISSSSRKLTALVLRKFAMINVLKLAETFCNSQGPWHTSRAARRPRSAVHRAVAGRDRVSCGHSGSREGGRFSDGNKEYRQPGASMDHLFRRPWLAAIVPHVVAVRPVATRYRGRGALRPRSSLPSYTAAPFRRRP